MLLEYLIIARLLVYLYNRFFWYFAETMFYSWLEGLCVEKRAFYRLISGLHASINIHLSARYLLQGKDDVH
ncbi:hypothetical protein GDO78_016231 [Eleutherodactylus coqui]|uniref:ERO1-like protein alpha n=1 Tax=Eleutherodactylus coqui TaxID=57060 RepID=A0A8J6E6C3_ELECQ|nr:hypothetical protein GDO78_016231 [Eleutherodactylus coqui]